MKRFLLLLALLTVVVLLWPSAFAYPLKILVVFFHETSHALMTVFTGGEVVELVVNQMQGGHVVSRGGNRFLVLSAGYLGSSLWGALIYLLAVGSRYDRAIMVLLGATIAAIALFFVRAPFALGFALATAVVMIFVGLKVNREINDLVLRLIGLTSMLYAPLDIYSDTIERSGMRSDAMMLAAEFGGAEMLWGAVWLAISAAVVLIAVLIGLKISPPTGARRTGAYRGWRDYSG